MVMSMTGRLGVLGERRFSIPDRSGFPWMAPDADVGAAGEDEPGDGPCGCGGGAGIGAAGRPGGSAGPARRRSRRVVAGVTG
ncbi:hypothetical protein GCM10010274_62680 [Streptomyces lavendofoliae]|uniref:Uncharacterized protein n=1 Tax=Streptomyces lavendofoliae TaxID=67314 RepID=A0A918I5K1_9ACTN|nr:hypothetical protein GCM10010274_62680 [Streptomyces lavendofoliae]